MPKLAIQCSSCNGTGLYVGCAERDGAAIVCHMCDGTGKTEFKYEEFTGKKVREGVNRVFAKSVGYVHSSKNVKFKEDGLIRFEDGGCTYGEWLVGVEPKPVKDLYCPYVWDNRGMGDEPCSRCKTGNTGLGRISECTFFKDKAKCWVEYEGEK